MHGRGEFARTTREHGSAPRCVVLTGPRDAERTRWLGRCIDRLQGDAPDIRCAVLRAEQGCAHLDERVTRPRAFILRRIELPCLCCPGRADLPGTLHALVGESAPDWLFLELPSIATAGLLKEFDRELRWPRSVVLWRGARRVGAESSSASPFQAGLIELADIVTTGSFGADAAFDRLVADQRVGFGDGSTPPRHARPLSMS